MKKNKIFALMAAAMTFAACSTSDITDDARSNNYDANNVTVASVTRAASDDANADNSTTTDVAPMSDPFFLTNLTQKAKAGYNYEAVFEYIEDSENSQNKYWAPKDGAKVMWYGSGYNDFQATYPCTKKGGAELQNIEFDKFMIPGYQYNNNNDNDSIPDWMRATALEKRTLDENGNVKPLNLNFEHMLSKVTLVCDYSGSPAPTIDGKPISRAEVSKIFTRVQYCKAVTGNDGKVTIEPYLQTDYGTDGLYVWTTNTTDDANKKASSTAIVAPGAYTKIGKISIYFKNGNNEYYDEVVVSVLNGITLEAGKHYTFTLKGNISHSPATISSVEVTDWVDGTMQNPEQPADYIPYVTFSAESEQKFKMTTKGDYIISGLQYSVNNGNWTDVTANQDVTFGGTNGNLRLRGKSIGGTSEKNDDGVLTKYATIQFTTSDVPVSCIGDIRTLVDYEDYKNVYTPWVRFGYLFQNCTQLTSAPILPITQLADYCYHQMFKDCSNLKSVTMLATDVSASNCLTDWLKDAGTQATSRTLKVNSKEEYDKIKATNVQNNSNLPGIWQAGASNTTILDKDGNDITSTISSTNP